MLCKQATKSSIRAEGVEWNIPRGRPAFSGLCCTAAEQQRDKARLGKPVGYSLDRTKIRCKILLRRDSFQWLNFVRAWTNKYLTSHVPNKSHKRTFQTDLRTTKVHSITSTQYTELKFQDHILWVLWIAIVNFVTGGNLSSTSRLIVRGNQAAHPWNQISHARWTKKKDPGRQQVWLTKFKIDCVNMIF